MIMGLSTVRRNCIVAAVPPKRWRKQRFIASLLTAWAALPALGALDGVNLTCVLYPLNVRLGLSFGIFGIGCRERR